MRINSVSVVVVAIVIQLLNPMVAVAADVPNGFRDLAWGAAPDKKLKKTTVPATGDIAVYRPRAVKPLPLFKVPVAEEACSFSKGKFFSASAWLDGKENFEKVRTALIEKYGQPSETINNYDRFSVAAERRNLWLWKWPESPVEVRLTYSEKYSRATVTYVNPGLTAPK
jgi:signal peptidase I